MEKKKKNPLYFFLPSSRLFLRSGLSQKQKKDNIGSKLFFHLPLFGKRFTISFFLSFLSPFILNPSATLIPAAKKPFSRVSGQENKKLKSLPLLRFPLLSFLPTLSPLTPFPRRRKHVVLLWIHTHTQLNNEPAHIQPPPQARKQIDSFRFSGTSRASRISYVVNRSPRYDFTFMSNGANEYLSSQRGGRFTTRTLRLTEVINSLNENFFSPSFISGEGENLHYYNRQQASAADRTNYAYPRYKSQDASASGESKPYFRSHGQTYKIKVGDPVTMTCVVENLGKWMRGLIIAVCRSLASWSTLP